MARSHRPSWEILRTMQMYSTRGWVYREGQGWIFDELTPDELVEFKSYKFGITIPRMRVRLPHYQATTFSSFEPHNFAPYNLTHWFAYCTMPQVHPLALSRFQIQQIPNEELARHIHHPVELGSYKAWLWTDDAKICRELGCEIIIQHGLGWLEREWRVPAEWRPPLQFKECIFIYALVDELNHEVYVGQTENLERRLVEHLRDTKHSRKVALIQNLCAQGCKPKLLKLEVVVGEKAIERERYWISIYKRQGYSIINQDHRRLS
jgi:predicted GIY-YIG superfamily endonuclease